MVFILMYGAGRAVSSNLRLDPIVFAGLQGGQLAGILYAIVGALGLAWLSLRARADVQRARSDRPGSP